MSFRSLHMPIIWDLSRSGPICTAEPGLRVSEPVSGCRIHSMDCLYFQGTGQRAPFWPHKLWRAGGMQLQWWVCMYVEEMEEGNLHLKMLQNVGVNTRQSLDFAQRIFMLKTERSHLNSQGNPDSISDFDFPQRVVYCVCDWKEHIGTNCQEMIGCCCTHSCS